MTVAPNSLAGGAEAMAAEVLVPRLLVPVLLALVINLPGDRALVGFPVLTLLFATLLEPRLLGRATYWFLIAAALSIKILHEPYNCANHYYLLTYLAASLGLTLGAPTAGRSEILEANTRGLLCAVMGLATLHKLLSAPFRSGAYLYQAMLDGTMLRSFGFKVSQRYDELTAANRELARAFRDADPRAVESVRLLDFDPSLAGAAMVATTLVIGVEMLLLVLFALRPRARVSHWLLLGFLAGVFVSREENVFLATVAVLGVSMCPRSRGGEQLVYLGMILLLLAFSLLDILNPL